MQALETKEKIVLKQYLTGFKYKINCTNEKKSLMTFYTKMKGKISATQISISNKTL